eukprot:gnl/Spiro4/62_TR34_c0_g1_i1.p2 gnl/Spiro4/62_TR34_c0_g1~~gnl/Spiro4/62_TR34_c0_g1_i1.p2  ORF type:complete len:201 (-),score=82.97 gnl/Spiro4/62_TR34_c0_g1_i1:102-632(-)
MASPDLLWLLVRNNSSFLVKRNGAEFTSEPGNLTNMNSFKFSGLANRKAVDLSIVKNKVTIGLKKSKQSKVRSPAKAWATSVLSRTTPRAGQIPASIRKITAGSHYRPDLARFAIARYHALRRTLAVKKADKKQQRRVRGRKAKAAAAAATQAKLAKATKKDAKPAAKKTDDKKKN